MVHLNVLLLAIKAATALIGVGKLTIIPVLLTTLAYFNYESFDPESNPIDIKVANQEYDFIVVGGGSAGSVVAARLTENPHWKVLLLEAGGQETEITDVPILSLFLHKSRIDWKYRSQAQPSACNAMKDNRCCWTRGKVIGGSSVLNTMLYIRGNKRDFDLWESWGNPGWGYEEALYYFKKSEDQRNPYLAKDKRHHATGGLWTVQDSPYNTPIGPAFIQAGQELGYDHIDVNGAQQTGFGLFQYNMRRGSRVSLAKAFLRPIRQRPNLHVSLWSHVIQVLIDPGTRRAYGIKYIRDGTIRTVYAKREVILSAGAINSPHLLMLSGIGPEQHLREVGINPIQDLPGVGQNLQDHIAVGGIAFIVDYPLTMVQRRFVNVPSALRYAILEDGPLTSSIGIETVAFIKTKYTNQSDDWPDMELMLTSSSTSSDGGTTVKKAHGLKDEFYDEVFREIDNRDVIGVFPMILRPKSTGYIKLASKNPLRYPLLYHNYLTHPDDIKVMREGIKTGIALGKTKALRRFGAKLYAKPIPNCKHIPQFTDEYWECVARQYTMTIYHMSCTTKMGPITDPMAVVDHRLKVRGITGLRVIDAGVMPQITSGNINAAVVMIAEKGSDMIKEDWLSGPRIKKQCNAIRNNTVYVVDC